MLLEYLGKFEVQIRCSAVRLSQLLRTSQDDFVWRGQHTT